MMGKCRVVVAIVHEGRVLVKEKKKLTNNCACVRLVTQYQLLHISHSKSNSKDSEILFRITMIMMIMMIIIIRRKFGRKEARQLSKKKREKVQKKGAQIGRYITNEYNVCTYLRLSAECFSIRMLLPCHVHRGRHLPKPERPGSALMADSRKLQLKKIVIKSLSVCVCV